MKLTEESINFPRVVTNNTGCVDDFIALAVINGLRTTASLEEARRAGIVFFFNKSSAVNCS